MGNSRDLFTKIGEIKAWKKKKQKCKTEQKQKS